MKFVKPSDYVDADVWSLCSVLSFSSVYVGSSCMTVSAIIIFYKSSSSLILKVIVSVQNIIA